MHAANSPPLLSICLPTFNRQDLLDGLVRQLLSEPGDFEVCVHVDGSTDATLDRLKQIADTRLRYDVSENMGRGSALFRAVNLARGRFVMLFDDDDTLFKEGLRVVLEDCKSPLPDHCVGFVYNLCDNSDHLVGSPFTAERANFLAIRADHRVTGDKKEVVLAQALKRVIMDGAGVYRRIPTSLFWSRLALMGDVMCRNIVIGRKQYLQGGMTSTIRRLKMANAWPMVLLYRSNLQGYLSGKYKSRKFAAKAAAGIIYYGALASANSIVRRAQFRA